MMSAQSLPTIHADNLAEVLDNLQIVVTLLTEDGVIVWANRTALALTRAPEQAVGSALADALALTVGAAPVLVDALARVGAGEGRRVEVEVQAGGRPRRLDLSLRRLPAKPDQAAQILVKGIDITEAARREHESATYRAVVDTNTDIISRLSPDGTLLFVNDAYCRFFGRTRAAVVGRAWQPMAHPDDVAAVQQALERMRPGEPIVIVEHRVIDGEGRVRWVEFVNRGFYGPDGDLVEFQSIGRDVTLRKEGEVERLRAERRMQERQRIEGLGLLAGGVAHDINNTLTCVVSNVALARHSIGDPVELSAALDEIDGAAERATALCRQMLAYAGKSPLTRTHVDLPRLIRGSRSLLRAALPSHATIRLDIASAVPAILGDETQLRQILLNLVTNAGDAVRTRGGVVSVSVRGAPAPPAGLQSVGLDVDLPAGETVILGVADDGVGMPPEVVARIFEPFFTTKTVGRGLGLAATLGLLRAHHAAVRVDSVPNGGTRFEVVFPAVAGAEPASVAPAARADAPGIHGRGLILVVDDDDAVRRAVSRQIEMLGYAVLQARDGPEGVEMFRRDVAEIRGVLLDFSMPGMNGDRMLREMQAERPDLPALVMSGGHATRDLREWFADLRVDEFIAKPFTIEVLRRALAGIVADA